METPPRHAWGLALAWLAAGLLLCLPFIDGYYEHTFESDASATVSAVLEYWDAFRYGAFSAISRPGHHPPYFDGPYFVHLAAMAAIKLPRALFAWHAALPTQASQAIAGIRWGNALAHALTVLPLMALAGRLHGAAWAKAGVGMLFLLSPLMLGIDLMRVDHVMLLAFVLLLWTLARWIEAPDRTGRAAAMGAAMGFLLSTKINAPVFVLLPGVSFLALAHRGAWPWRGFAVAVGVGLAVFCALGFRYLMFLPDAPAIALAKLDFIREWYSNIGTKEPRLFYHWHSMLPMGPLFPLAALAGFVALGRRAATSSLALMLAGTFVLLSLMALATYKYERGGYVLLPLYLLGLAHTLRFLPPIAGKILLSICLAWTGVSYASLARDSLARAENVRVTRVEAHAWLKTHVRPGARAAIFIHSDWALPHTADLPMTVDDQPFAFPYRDPAAFRAYPVPTLESLRRDYDLILLNDHHPRVMFDEVLRGYFGDAGRAAEWETLVADLLALPGVQSFQADVRAYNITRVDVVVLNPEILR